MKCQTLATACLISIALSTLSFGVWVPLTGSPVPISSLPAGGLVVGDKIFAEFDMFGMAGGGAIAPSADTVFVQGGQETDTGDYGLRFLMSWNAFCGQTISVPSLSYRVSALPDGEPIKDVSMFLRVAGATGSGGVTANETVLDGPFGNVITTLQCSTQENDGGVSLKDYDEFEPVMELWISKGFSVTGGGAANGSASLSELFQLYSQVPEPATIALLGLGALALMRKRRP